MHSSLIICNNSTEGRDKMFVRSFIAIEMVLGGSNILGPIIRSTRNYLIFL